MEAPNNIVVIFIVIFICFFFLQLGSLRELLIRPPFETERCKVFYGKDWEYRKEYRNFDGLEVCSEIDWENIEILQNKRYPSDKEIKEFCDTPTFLELNRWKNCYAE